mmetsp:Transcript_17076/g.40746  ORF Transcript_17076/g.40746 Transcript_17076/m.40746 type:complete len:482 (+) Transcript_17076:535-1980(+)
MPIEDLQAIETSDPRQCDVSLTLRENVPQRNLCEVQSHSLALVYRQRPSKFEGDLMPVAGPEVQHVTGKFLRPEDLSSAVAESHLRKDVPGESPHSRQLLAVCLRVQLLQRLELLQVLALGNHGRHNAPRAVHEHAAPRGAVQLEVLQQHDLGANLEAKLLRREAVSEELVALQLSPHAVVPRRIAFLARQNLDRVVRVKIHLVGVQGGKLGAVDLVHVDVPREELGRFDPVRLSYGTLALAQQRWDRGRSASAADVVQDRHKLRVLLPEYLGQQERPHVPLAPDRALEGETPVVERLRRVFRAEALLDGRQLEEVPAEDHLDPAPRTRIAADAAGLLLELGEELGGHHADLVDDQDLHGAPALLRLLLPHAVKVVAGLRDAAPREGVERGPGDVGRGDPRGRGDRHLLGEQRRVPLPEHLDDEAHEERLARPCVPREEHAVALADEIDDLCLLLAQPRAARRVGFRGCVRVFVAAAPYSG